MKSLALRMIDLNLIERGADYNDLRKNYIIFICPFDVEEWRLEYMTLLMRDNQMREEGRQEGRIEGRIQVYRNLRRKGFSKEEALAFAEIPASAVEDDEEQAKQE